MAYGTFVPKDWEDAPSTATSLSAANIEDLEARLAAEASSQGRAVFNVLTDHGAVGDGVADDTAAINEAITAANALGGGDVYLPPCDGGYGITLDATPIDLLSNVRLIGAGWPSRLVRIGTFEKTVGRRMIRAAAATNGVENSAVIDVVVNGNEGEIPMESTLLNGATVGGETTITVDDTTDFPTAGELISGTNSQFSYTGKTATTFTGCVDVEAMADNTPIYESVGNISAQFIRYEPLDENEHHRHIRIRGCQIVDWPSAAMSISDCEHFGIVDNDIENATRGGIVLFHDNSFGVVSANRVQSADDCLAIQAAGNTSSAAKGTGARHIAFVGNTVESHGIPNQGTNNGVNIQGLAHGVVANNTIIGAGETGGENKAGIRMGLSDGLNAAARYELRHCSFVGNRIYSPEGYGIYLTGDSTVTEPCTDIKIADNAIYDPGTRGIWIDGYVVDLQLNNNKVRDANRLNEAAMDAIRITDAHGFQVDGNKCNDSRIQCRYGIKIESTCADGEIENNVCRDAEFVTLGFDNDAPTSVTMRNNITGVSFKTVPSAATLTLRDGYRTQQITGTTTITSITASWPDREVVLKFSGILTLTDGSNLKLNGNFVTSADDTITLVCDGTNWYEIARSAN